MMQIDPRYCNIVSLSLNTKSTRYTNGCLGKLFNKYDLHHIEEMEFDGSHPQCHQLKIPTYVNWTTGMT